MSILLDHINCVMECNCDQSKHKTTEEHVDTIQYQLYSRELKILQTQLLEHPNNVEIKSKLLEIHKIVSDYEDVLNLSIDQYNTNKSCTSCESKILQFT
jgi:flagellar basal body rod protein FlgB